MTKKKDGSYMLNLRGRHCPQPVINCRAVLNSLDTCLVQIEGGNLNLQQLN